MLSDVLITLAGVGIIYVFVRHRRKIFNRIQRALDFRNALRNQHIEVVTTRSGCEDIVSKLRKACESYKVLGFDCEWVTVGGSRRPISLLQLASQSGLCGLFRLNSLKSVPLELRDLLQDEDILKVGIVPQEDAKVLAREYGVTVASTLDLRHLAVLAGRKPLGLSKLSADVLNIELDKDWRIRCSDWEAPEMNTRQLVYAANDAHAAVEIFKVLADEIVPRTFFQSQSQRWKEILNLCEPYVDWKFSGGFGSMSTASGGKKEEARSQNAKNPMSRNLFTRAKALYDNCLLQAPDGELLCTLDKRKAEWYLSQNLGTLVSQVPYTVRLNFEPAGRAVGDVGKYYTMIKENKCVVCGRSDAYIRKNVVPREYRKHFPVVMKSHTSHDVLPLCPPCHQRSNMSDLQVRHRLGALCGAPLTCDTGGAVKFKEVPRLRHLRSAAKALLNNADRIPDERKQQLRNVVLENYPGESEVTEDILRTAAEIDTMEEDESYVAHGEKVVAEFKNKHGGLIELEKIWRKHFLDVMRPKYLPEFWSVNHNENRLAIRLNEGRIEETDVRVAGLKIQQRAAVSDEIDDDDDAAADPATNLSNR